MRSQSAPCFVVDALENNFKLAGKIAQAASVMNATAGQAVDAAARLDALAAKVKGERYDEAGLKAVNG